MTDLALDDQISGTIRLYDIDRQAAENNCSDRKSPYEPGGRKWVDWKF